MLCGDPIAEVIENSHDSDQSAANVAHLRAAMLH